MAVPDYHVLFQASPCALLVLSPDLTIVAASDSYLRATMTEREDIVGRPVFEAFPDDPEDREPNGGATIRASLAAVLRDRQPASLPAQRYPIRRPRVEGGAFEERFWTSTNVPVLDARGEVAYILHHAEDVTELVRLEHKRVAQERDLDLMIARSERFVQLLDMAPDATVILGEDGRIQLVNVQTERLFGYPRDELIGEPLDMLIPERFRTAHAGHLRRFFASPGSRPMGSGLALYGRRRDGSELPIEVSLSPQRGPHGFTVSASIRDISERRRLEADAQQAREAAEAASAAKSEFLSSMSHELRTPLNAILGFAQLLQRDKREPLSERHRERIAHILNGGEHLLRLIDDILDLARIEAGRVSLFIEPVDLVAVLHGVVRTLEPIAARHDITLAVAQAPGVSTVVAADRTRLTQVVMNLGSNAIKYNRPGGSVSFTLAMSSATNVRVTVRDTGIGVPTDKQDTLFQPFQRAGQETGPIEGTGIGLVITKQLTQLMGGDVGFQSVEGEGSSFWIELPARDARALHAAPPSAVGACPQPARTDADRHLVLYVEDNPANVTFMRDLVDTFDNIELLVACTAELSIDVARTRKPRVIIMDINLPGMSGFEALRVLRSSPDTRDIPVIALTAAASERDAQLGREAGFFRYLTKPVRVDALLETLAVLLDTPA